MLLFNNANVTTNFSNKQKFFKIYILFKLIVLQKDDQQVRLTPLQLFPKRLP